VSKIRIEKIKCDGCGKEYNEGDPGITIRIQANEKARTTVALESVKVGVSGSLDFCNVTCFQAYITKQNSIPKEP
jgi:hypothetical protein